MLFIFQYLFDKFFSNDCYLGPNSYGKPRIVRYGTKEKAFIGKFCSIAQNVTFILTGNHRTDWISTYPFPVFKGKWVNSVGIESYIASKGNIVVGNDVWIGYGALILPGIKIGDGAVIGAYSVVSKNVPPYTIVGGNPARIIRKRFNNKIINKLLKIAWWDWPDEKINDASPLLCSKDIKSFIKEFGNNL